MKMKRFTAALLAAAAMLQPGAQVYAYDNYGGVWGAPGYILEDEEVVTRPPVTEPPADDLIDDEGTDEPLTDDTSQTEKPPLINPPVVPLEDVEDPEYIPPRKDKTEEDNKRTKNPKKDKSAVWRDYEEIVDSSDAKYSYNDMCKDIDDLMTAYPGLFKVRTLADTADKRKIYDIVLGNEKAPRQIVIQAGCHAREYMTSLLVMDQLEYCLQSCGRVTFNGKLLSEYLEDTAVHIVPMLNPDGVTISQEGAAGLKNPQLRKNVKTMYKNAVALGLTEDSESRYFERWKANAHGVDINRNFDGKWEYADSAPIPCGLGYKGVYPESEAESKAIVTLINSLSNPVTVISYHATGSLLWWDYSQQGEYRNRCYNEVSAISGMTGYKLNPYDRTSAAGLCDRIIAKGRRDIVPILIEVGIGNCPLGIEEYPRIYKENYKLIPMLLVYFDR